MFCLFFYTLYASKAKRISTPKLKDRVPTTVDVPPDGLSVDLWPPYGTSVINGSHCEETSLNNYSISNFSTTTELFPVAVVDDRNLRTVASLQWIGTPPYHVSPAQDNCK